MAQPIQVPQPTPNPVQFQPLTDLINAYMARRQQDQQFATNKVQELAGTVNTLHQQKIQNQLAALGAISQLYGAGGPRAVQTYGAGVNQVAGSQMIPQQQPNIPPQGTPQNATLPPNQDQAPSPYIQASLAAGHPDVAGVGSFHAPQPSSTDIQDIESGGTYGRNKAQSFKDLGDLAMQPITAQQKGIDIQKGTNDLSLFPTEKALKSQQLINAQAEIPMKVGAQQSEIAKGIAPKMTDIKNLQSTLDQMKQFNSSPDAKSIPFTGNIGSKYVAANPGTTSKWAKNQYNADQTAEVGAGIIEKLAEGRYNDAQKVNIRKSFFPTGNELGTQIGNDKLTRFQNYITQMKSGQIDQANAQLDAIAGSGFNPKSLGTPVPVPNGSPTGLTGPHGQTVVQNGHTYTWNGKSYE